MSDAIDDLSALEIERAPLNTGGRRWGRWLALLVVLGGTGGGAYWWMNRVVPLEVEVAQVTQRAVGAQASVLNASGYVTARRRATVSSKVTGKVVEVNVEEGMAVREGQVLARLDDSTVRASLELAQAQLEASRRAVPEVEVRLEEARLVLGRRERLSKDGLATPADMDQAQAEVDSLIARIASLREQVARRRAPGGAAADGTRRHGDPGAVLGRGDSARTPSPARWCRRCRPAAASRAPASAPSSTCGRSRSRSTSTRATSTASRPGSRSTAVLDAYPDFEIPAKVIAVVPTADRQKATVLVRIGFNALDPRILPDMGVKVTFLREEAAAATPAARPVALVPKGAVRAENGGSYVYVVKQDTVERRAVQTGGTDGDRLEVTGGLSSGERIVVSPPPELAAGTPIVIKQ